MACETPYLLNAWAGDRKFDFVLLSEYAQRIYDACPSDPRLVPGGILLTLEASMEFARETYAWPSWNPYVAGAILTRLLTWKTPLVQLVFQFSRSPLNWNVELFAINHLIGDPMNTLASLMLTLELCESRATECRKGKSAPHWKEETLIHISSADCGEPLGVKADVEKAAAFLRLTPVFTADRRRVARHLAANRSTKFLPIIVSLLLFNGSFGLAYGRTVSQPESVDNWIPIELHSVAFSACFLWLTEAVLLSALIGVPQTAASVLSILNIPERSAADRVAAGALPSWQPNMGQRTVSTWRVAALNSVAVMLVASSTFIAWAISFAVPPERFGCRHAAQGAILGFWLASYAIGLCLSRMDLPNKTRFISTYIKDAIASTAVIAIVMITQWGIFNRSTCWADSSGLQLPQVPSVSVRIKSRVRVVYPCIIFMGIAFQLVACMLIAMRYRHAIRVFCQRDDGKSNWSHFWNPFKENT